MKYEEIQQTLPHTNKERREGRGDILFGKNFDQLLTACFISVITVAISEEMLGQLIIQNSESHAITNRR